MKRKAVFIHILFLICLHAFAQAPEDTTYYRFECHDKGFIQHPFDRAVNITIPAIPGEIISVPSLPPTMVEECGVFRIHYDLTKPVGFVEPGANGAARRQVLCDVLNYINGVIEIPESAYPIDIDVSSDHTSPQTATYIASAAPYSSAAYDNSVPGYYGGLLYDHIITGTDPDPVKHDAFVRVDFGNLIDPATQCPADLFTILLHEMTHALGFGTLVGLNSDNTQVVSKANGLATGPFSMWDKFFLYKRAGSTFTKLVTGTTTPTVSAGIVPADLSGGNIWLNSNAISSKENLPVSSLAPYYSGTNLSHLDDLYDFDRCHDSPGFVPIYVMPPFYFTTGINRREYTPQEARILKQLGYTIKSTSSFFTLLNNRPPHVASPMMLNQMSGPNSYMETGAGLSSSLTLTISNCQQAVINLSSRAELSDTDGDKIRVYPNSLFNIRGCGEGGNNHNRLSIATVSGGDIITFTPRSNFIGRAQFGFYLYDGKERGDFVVYTIIVTKDSCFDNDNKLIINGEVEEGQEFTHDLNPNTENNWLWSIGYLRRGNYQRPGWIMGHTDGMHLFHASVDLTVKDGYKPCTYTFRSTPYVWTNPAYTGDRVLGMVANEITFMQLAESIKACGKYTLEFDMVLNPGLDSIRLAIGSTATFGFPDVSRLKFTVKNNGGAWQRVRHSFNINKPVTGEDLFCFVMEQTHENGTGLPYVLADNFSLVLDSMFVPFTVSAAKTNPSCLTVTDGSISLSVSGGNAPITYIWSNGYTTSTIAGVGVGTYSATITDASGCFRTISVLLSNPVPCSGPCAKSYTGILSDTINAGGGTVNYSGQYFVSGNEIILKNGTFNLSPGTVFWSNGHPLGDGFRPLIKLEDATLNVTNARLSSCSDTLWGGILANSTASLWRNTINITGTGTDSAEISDAYIGIEGHSINADRFVRYNVVQTRFKNNHQALHFSELSFGHAKDNIRNCSFYFHSATKKKPLTGMSQAIHISNVLDNVEISGNRIKDANIGLDLRGHTRNFIITQNIFDRNRYSINCLTQKESPSFNPDTLKIINNTFNMGLTGEVGAFISGWGFKANDNAFTGNLAAGHNQTGIAHSVVFDQNGIQIKDNLFRNVTAGIDNLNLKYQGATDASILENTFEGNQSGVYTNNNDNLPAPKIQVRCNTFRKAAYTGTAYGINVENRGQFATQGSCSPIGMLPAGNRYIGYTGGLDRYIRNAGASGYVYNRSSGESIPITKAVGFAVQCGLFPSNCPAGEGSPVVDIAPTLAEVLLAVEELRKNILMTAERQAELLQTVIAYYRDNCGPDYENTVNQMLPSNLGAYTVLAWNLTECYIADKNIPLAETWMQQIVYNNPGSVEVMQRTNYYHLLVKIQEQSAHGEYTLTPADLQVLADVAASGTDFSAAACYQLRALDPAGFGGSCLTYPESQSRYGRNQEKAVKPETDSRILFLDVSPNPFSESTVINYQLAENVKKAALKIYDVQGRMVKALNLATEESFVRVYADEMKNGVYFFTIEADGMASVKRRMVVIK